MHPIENLIGRKEDNDEVFSVINTIMVTRNMSYSEVLNIPLPFAWRLLKEIKKEQDKLKNKK